MTSWHYGLLTLWHPDWPPDVMTSWHYSLLTLWHPDIMASWRCDILTSWHPDIMASWRCDILTSWPLDVVTSWRCDIVTLWPPEVDVLTLWHSDMLAIWLHHNCRWASPPSAPGRSSSCWPGRPGRRSRDSSWIYNQCCYGIQVSFSSASLKLSPHWSETLFFDELSIKALPRARPLSDYSNVYSQN